MPACLDVRRGEDAMAEEDGEVCREGWMVDVVE
jgi:hypothetical protein